MNNLYKRPMFRKGGSAEGGITSGLQSPRQGYNTNENNTVKQNDLSKVNLRDMNMQQIQNLANSFYPERKDPRPSRRFNDFLINFGLDIASRSPQGNIFNTIAASAKDPFAQFQTTRAAENAAMDVRDEAMIDRRSDMFGTLLGAQADILGSEGGSKTFAKQANDAEIQSLMTSLFELEANQKTDQALSDEEFNKQQSILMQRLQGYTGKNPAVTSLFGNKAQAEVVIGGIQNDIVNSERIIKVMGPDGEMVEVVEGEYAAENPKYIGEETARRYIELYNKMVKDSIGLAEGGRANYANGEMVESRDIRKTEQMIGDSISSPREEGIQVSEKMVEEIAPTGDSLSYEELRARLPQEITDDIIVILAESPQALVDFAEIQTQTDVDEFNMKYGVNLSLPSGA